MQSIFTVYVLYTPRQAFCSLCRNIPSVFLQAEQSIQDDNIRDDNIVIRDDTAAEF
jgi:hypothetical protein